MRYFWVLFVWLFATSAAAQQDEKPGFFDRLFGTDDAASDEQQGTLLEQLIADSLSGDDRVVTVTGFQGALSGRATLESLTIADPDGVWLTLNDAVLDWDRGALFRGALEIAELSAGEIRLPRLAAPAEGEAPTPEAQGFQLPELPVSINIGDISANQVFIGEPVFGAEANVSLNGNLALAGGEGSANLTLARLDGRGGVALEVAYANATGQLAIDLRVEEEPDGILVNLAEIPGLPSVDFSITGDAPVQTFEAFINLATDNSERLSGTVTLSKSGEAQRIQADISGDIAPVFAPEYRAFFGDAIRLKTDALAHPDGRWLIWN
jgi:translocation and assembly module TamB